MTMNAAQKAWATRRARAAAALLATAAPITPVAAWQPSQTQTISATAADVRRTAEVDDCHLVELYVEDDKVGSGRRLFVVLETGASMVRLFQPSQLVTITVCRKYFDRKHIAQKRGVARQRVAEIIRRNRALADRVNDAKLLRGADMLQDGGADAVRALQLLVA
jgi:hypothetical protein